MKKKYKLKRWVKVTLGVVFAVIVIGACVEVSVSRMKQVAKECDQHYGRTCSYYEIEQWVRGIKK